MEWTGKIHGLPVEGEVRMTSGKSAVHLEIRCHCKYWTTISRLEEALKDSEIWEYSTIVTTGVLSAYIDADSTTDYMFLMKKITYTLDVAYEVISGAALAEKNMDTLLQDGVRHASNVLANIVEEYKEYKY